MDLILQLKQEHIEIKQSFGEIKSEGSAGNISDPDLVDELSRLKDLIITHLDLEDKLLYPPLVKCENPKARKIGGDFSEEMRGISKVTFAFFEKYMKISITDLLKSSVFRKELDGIIKSVTKRLNTEEKVLFPAYQKYCEVKK